MRYMGGKSRLAPHLAPRVLETDPSVVVEPFCGALHMTVAMLRLNPDLIVHASDAHDDLIEMWKAVADGWVPPSHCTRAQYHEAKDAPSSPERTFIGYGCSFSGVWFGGYAADKTGRNYCLNAKRSIDKIRDVLPRIVFSSHDYSDTVIPPDSVMYCDPPYAGTSTPGDRRAFDTPSFWEWVRNLPIRSYVSEYAAPDDFETVWQKEVKTDMITTVGKSPRIEKLFMHKPTTH